MREIIWSLPEENRALLWLVRSSTNFLSHLARPKKGRDTHAPVSPPFYIHRSALCKHLDRIAQQADVNKMTPRNIGVVFGPTLFKSADPLQGLADISNFNAIVEKIIQHFELLFSHDMPEALQEASATAAGYEDTSRGTAVALYDYDGAVEGDDYYLPLIEDEVLESVRIAKGGKGKTRTGRDLRA